MPIIVDMGERRESAFRRTSTFLFDPLDRIAVTCCCGVRRFSVDIEDLCAPRVLAASPELDPKLAFEREVIVR